MIIYDEPTAHLHTARDYAKAPDKKRQGFVDKRVVVTLCMMNIALFGMPKNKPKNLIRCVECFYVSP